MHLLVITRGDTELVRCVIASPGHAHEVIGHDAYINWGGAGSGVTVGTTPDGRAFRLEHIFRAPQGVETYTATRLFEPAPTQITGQLTL